MSKKRLDYYMNWLESLYKESQDRLFQEDYEAMSLDVVNRAFGDIRLLPAEYYTLCKRRAELVIKYGKEAV